VQNPRERQWALDVRGPGGGQWELVVRRGQLVAVEMGLHNESSTICRTDADTFAEIMQGRLTWQTAFATGAAQVIGDSAATREATSLLSQLADVPVPSETPQPQTV
jgi:hypothetical protein